MFFKRIGAKKHKYELQVTLSTIKYCPWNSPCIKIVLVRGDHQAESPEYVLYKGRCNLDNFVLSVPCTMFFDNGKYLEKQAEIKIKAYDQQKRQLGETLSKMKLDLVQYTDEDRLYQEQLNFDAARLSCSFYMKLVDDNALTEDTNTQKSHLSIKTEKVGKEKEKEGKGRSSSKERKTLNFGKSNRLITEPDDVEIQGNQDKEKKRERKERREEKEKESRRKQSYDVSALLDKGGKEAEVSTSGTKTKEKERYREKGKGKEKGQEIEGQKQLQKGVVKQFNFGDIKPKQSPIPFSPLPDLRRQTPFKNSKDKSLAKEYMYQKQLQQKNQLMSSLQQQNERLKYLLEQQVISQPIQTKESANKISKLEDQNQKLRQKIIEKEIQLSEYQLKMKGWESRENAFISDKKSRESETKMLREQLETVKGKVVEALTAALESGNSQLIAFIQDYFSFE